MIAATHLGSGADENAVGGKNQCVAAIKDGQGRERMQPGVEGAGGECGVGVEKGGSRSRFKSRVRASGLEALAGARQGLARIVAENSSGQRIGDGLRRWRSWPFEADRRGAAQRGRPGAGRSGARAWRRGTRRG